MADQTDHEKAYRRHIASEWMHVCPMVSAYIRSVVFSFHDAEDLIQEVAMAFAEHFTRIDTDKPILPWALSIARHKVIDYLRAKGRRRHVFDEAAMQHITEAYQSVEPEGEDIKAALNECMERLSDRPRHVIELRYLRDMNIAGIAGRLGLSHNAVYVMLHRIRESLANCVRIKLKMQWDN